MQRNCNENAIKIIIFCVILASSRTIYYLIKSPGNPGDFLFLEGD